MLQINYTVICIRTLYIDLNLVCAFGIMVGFVPFTRWRHNSNTKRMAMFFPRPCTGSVSQFNLIRRLINDYGMPQP